MIDDNNNNSRRHYYCTKDQPYLLYGQEGTNDNDNSEEDEDDIIPTANIRTYNIMLKGYVKDENMNQALKLSKKMKESNLWDDITTNTLVSVAVATHEFDLAESILTNYTNHMEDDKVVGAGKGPGTSPSNGKKKKRTKNTACKQNQQHPNVEAYTELLDGYVKANNLNKALYILKTMRERGVNPNEYTYTCMIGAWAKKQKFK